MNPQTIAAEIETNAIRWILVAKQAKIVIISGLMLNTNTNLKEYLKMLERRFRKQMNEGRNELHRDFPQSLLMCAEHCACLSGDRSLESLLSIYDRINHLDSFYSELAEEFWTWAIDETWGNEDLHVKARLQVSLGNWSALRRDLGNRILNGASVTFSTSDWRETITLHWGNGEQRQVIVEKIDWLKRPNNLAVKAA